MAVKGRGREQGLMRNGSRETPYNFLARGFFFDFDPFVIIVEDTLLSSLSWCRNNPIQNPVHSSPSNCCCLREYTYASCIMHDQQSTSSASGQKWKTRPRSQLSINNNPSSYRSEDLYIKYSASPLCFQDIQV